MSLGPVHIKHYAGDELVDLQGLGQFEGVVPKRVLDRLMRIGRQMTPRFINQMIPPTQQSQSRRHRSDVGHLGGGRYHAGSGPEEPGCCVVVPSGGGQVQRPVPQVPDGLLQSPQAPQRGSGATGRGNGGNVCRAHSRTAAAPRRLRS